MLEGLLQAAETAERWADITSAAGRAKARKLSLRFEETIEYHVTRAFYAYARFLREKADVEMTPTKRTDPELLMNATPGPEPLPYERRIRKVVPPPIPPAARKRRRWWLLWMA